MTILNSIRYADTIEFSEAIPIEDEALYIVFRTKTISIPIKSSKKSETRIKTIEKMIKRKKIKFSSSNVSVEPIAYIVKLKLNKKTSRYLMSPLNDEHAEYVKKNKKEILTEFLGRQGIPAEKYKFEYFYTCSDQKYSKLQNKKNPCRKFKTHLGIGIFSSATATSTRYAPSFKDSSIAAIKSSLLLTDIAPMS